MQSRVSTDFLALHNQDSISYHGAVFTLIAAFTGNAPYDCDRKQEKSAERQAIAGEAKRRDA